MKIWLSHCKEERYEKEGEREIHFLSQHLRKIAYSRKEILKQLHGKRDWGLRRKSEKAQWRGNMFRLLASIQEKKIKGRIMLF